MAKLYSKLSTIDYSALTRDEVYQAVVEQIKELFMDTSEPDKWLTRVENKCKTMALFVYNAFTSIPDQRTCESPTPEASVSRKKRLINYLKKHPELKTDRDKTILRILHRELNSKFFTQEHAKNSAYRMRVSNRKTDEIDIIPEPLIKQARELLSTLRAKNGKLDPKEDGDWRDVSCALIIVTGRRMGEIHSTGKIEPLFGNMLSFSGQLKTKKELDYPFPILSLADVDDVLFAWDWLGQKCFYNRNTGEYESRRASTPEEANRKWQKTIERVIKSETFRDKKAYDWRITVLRDGDAVKLDGVPKGDGTDEAFHYHHLRGFYYACVKRLARQSDMKDTQYEEFTNKVLGHEGSDTKDSYKRFSVVSNINEFNIVLVP